MEEIKKMSDNDLEEVSGGSCCVKHYYYASGKDCWYVTPDIEVISFESGAKINERGKTLGPYNTLEEAVAGAHADGRIVSGLEIGWESAKDNANREKCMHQFETEKKEVYEYLKRIGDMHY